MRRVTKYALRASVGALVAGLGLSQAMAYDALPNLENLDFTQYSGNAPKDTFTAVNPVGWTGGSGLIYIDSQTYSQSAAGGTNGIMTYGNPTGSVTGNYVEADGNPYFESGFNYTVTGLTVGKTYTLSFYQGASQMVGYANGQETTNRWIVSLGTSGLQTTCCNATDDPVYGGPVYSYFNSDSNASIATSPLMTVPSAGTVGWNYVSVNLTADATTDVLSFLAWADNGSSVNLPPIAFLAGVDSPPGLGSGAPEASTWMMMGVGFLGLAGVAMRQRGKRTTKAIEA